MKRLYVIPLLCAALLSCSQHEPDEPAIDDPVADCSGGNDLPCECECWEPVIYTDTLTVCGVKDPLNNLPWLAEIMEMIKRAEAAGGYPLLAHYTGTVWYTTYHGKSVFVTDMLIPPYISQRYHTFDCDRNPAGIDDDSFYNGLYYADNKHGVFVLYSNMTYFCY